MVWVYLALASALVALAFAGVLAYRVTKEPPGSKAMVLLSQSIRDGAIAFLAREYRSVGVFVFAVAAILGLALGIRTAVIFVAGAGLSTLAGYVGMRIATAANARTTHAAESSLNGALRLAFSSGAVMGMTVVGLGLLGISIVYFVLRDPAALAGFGFGASSIALFARVGGGIFTKAADIGADLVGKVEAGIPEDDPRNPAVIADNVGDNVGDVAGMGADLYESYVGSIIAAMALSVAAVTSAQPDLPRTILPLAIAAGGIVASILGTFAVRVSERADLSALLGALRRGVILASVLVVVFSLGIVLALNVGLGVFGAVAAGLIAGVLIGLTTEYYTSHTYKPTQGIAEAALAGPATVIIHGLATAMASALGPVLILVAAILVAYTAAGLYGIAIAAVGMLSTLGITLATDAYGPVADNAGGIAQMAGLPPHVRARTDALDALGNSTAATGKGFAIGSAVLTSLALMAAYANAANVAVISLLDVNVLVGLIIGGLLPFLFSSMALGAVGNAAFQMVHEVRRQFREIPGLLEGKAAADPVRCVDIATAAALRLMIVPGLLAVLAPLVVGFGLGKEALGGMLAGATVAGFLLAIVMANAGGSWDNAKKYIESGAHGGRGSAAHHAAVVGDTVGDPLKDTAGPSLNILIKLMSIVSLVFAPILARL